eukprot:scaffold14305_cov76-Isochrysis_galbana.AAC.2
MPGMEAAAVVRGLITGVLSCTGRRSSADKGAFVTGQRPAQRKAREACRVRTRLLPSRRRPAGHALQENME